MNFIDYLDEFFIVFLILIHISNVLLNNIKISKIDIYFFIFLFFVFFIGVLKQINLLQISIGLFDYIKSFG